MIRRTWLASMVLAGVLSFGTASALQTGSVKATIDAPRSASKVTLTRDGTGLWGFPVDVKAHGLGRNVVLLLWVNPINPSGDGWYLQRGRNGLGAIGADDASWSGRAQVGNVEYPPRNGQEFEIAISVLDKREAERLVAQRDIVALREPRGSVVAKASRLVTLIN